MSYSSFAVPETDSDGNLEVFRGDVDPANWAETLDPGGSGTMTVNAQGKGSGRITIQIKASGQATQTYTKKLDKGESRAIELVINATASSTGESFFSETDTKLTAHFDVPLTSTSLEVFSDVAGNCEKANIQAKRTAPGSSDPLTDFDQRLQGSGNRSMTVVAIQD